MSRRPSPTLVPVLLTAGALVLTACGDQTPGGMPEEGAEPGHSEVAEGGVDDGNGDDAPGAGAAADEASGEGTDAEPEDGFDDAAPDDPIVVQIGDDQFETIMAIYRRYDEAKGGPLALLAPVAPAEDVAGGTRQDFRDGAIFWTPDTGAQIVRGQILDAYLDNGGPTGRLGWPVGDETEDGEVVFSDFQNGQIRLEDASIHVVEHEES